MTDSDSLHVTINIDGGARGNPGPAGAGFVIRSSDDGTILHEAGVFLGSTTNNVAEYSALVAALKAAANLGATEVDVFSDSELLVRQMTGLYRVRNDGLKPLYEQAQVLAGRFDRFNISHVSREQNKDADRLVNEALDERRSVGDAVV